jgi:WD40 repeat protein
MHRNRHAAPFWALVGFFPLLLMAATRGQEPATKPSPLDKLDATAIPAEYRFKGQPKELVAVLRAKDQASASSVAFSPDSKWLAVGSSSVVRMWDLVTLREHAFLKERHSGLVSSIAFAPDGKVLASAGDHPFDLTVFLWHLGGDQPRRVELPHRHQHWVHSVAFSADGKTLITAGDMDETVALWDLSGDKPKERHLLKHPESVTALAVSRDGKTLACAYSLDTGHVRLWDLRGGAPKERTALEGEDRWWVGTLTFAPDGKTLAVGRAAGSEFRLWDLSGKPKEKVRLRGKGGMAVGPTAIFTHDGKRLVTAGGERLLVWDTDGKILHQWRLASRLNSIALAPDGRHLAITNANGTVFILRLPSGDEGVRP